jgi:murein DD-endopeptidase MepM/ murein hydrolase activator NlpD
VTRSAGRFLLGVAAASLLVVTNGSPASADSSSQALEDKVDMTVEAPESGQAKEENAQLAALAALAEQTVGEILENAWHLPIAPGAYHLTAGFGECSSLWSHCHTGLDFAAPEGTPILAVANGVITETGWAGAYGNRTVMTLEDGTELWFCHQSAFGVETGDQVVGGQPIGLVGATGNTTGPHLHLEVRPGGGDAVDPAEALTVHGVAP